MAEEKLEEKIPSKDDPSDSLKKKKKKKIQLEEDSLDSPKKKKKKKKKKIRLEEDSLDTPKKKKKKRIQSEDDSPDTPKKKKKKKKKVRSKGSKEGESPVKKILTALKEGDVPVKKWVLRILIVFGVLGGFYMVQKSNEAKAIAKTYMVSLAALNKLQISCTALWSEVGIDKACDQALAEKAIGKYSKDVKLTVIEGRSHKFRADIQHRQGDKIFRVNKKGDLFLNTNGCLSKLSIMNPDVEQINRMASTCKTPSS